MILPALPIDELMLFSLSFIDFISLKNPFEQGEFLGGN